MSTLIAIAIIVSAAVIIGVLSFYFGKKQSVLRRLSKLKDKDILQFRTNEPTKVTGKVLHVHQPFVAPFSKRKCVAYEFKIQQKKSSGKNSYWKTLVKENNIQDFFVEKKGDMVMVKPITAPLNFDIYLVEDKTITSGFLNNPSPEFKKLLSKFSISSETYFGFNKTLRYSERILEIGETVTVGGIAKWKNLDTTVTGYNYSKIATLESGGKQNIIITDLPEAKTIKRKRM
ncbi:hypothetical protein CLV33_105332 [Jejuia pallidilutea]|uniref:RING-type E3 ubiquitin transferase n=1 Tax=Jejuia pallidilutea TaxID=504487 RepID=A0A362XCF3_9FLAO|nr:hypothetical protein [Jejuia pallidilutea]PQV48472.1 hypothetical protein CLV33_105332 [Jejuia pallidilutea]